MNPDVSAMWSQFTGATARAVAGAQGTTGAGSPLFAELQSIQNAMTDTRTRLYQSNIEKYYADGSEGEELSLQSAGGSVETTHCRRRTV